MRSSSSYCNKLDLVGCWIQSKTRVTIALHHLFFFAFWKWKHQKKFVNERNNNNTLSRFLFLFRDKRKYGSDALKLVLSSHSKMIYKIKLCFLKKRSNRWNRSRGSEPEDKAMLRLKWWDDETVKGRYHWRVKNESLGLAIKWPQTVDGRWNALEGRWTAAISIWWTSLYSLMLI